jgi:pimeloyl-ACP methyl ester carboxylesterase
MSSYQHEGVTLHYDITGAGPPVLCVHGATGTGSYEWSKVAQSLSDRYRFVIPDLRGHGRSDYRPGAMSIEAVDGDMRALIKHEQLGRPHVLGFSFGAEAALELELTNPGTAASLILISPGLGDPKSSVPSRHQLEAGWPRTLRGLHAEKHGEQHWLHVMLELCERAAGRPKTDLGALAALTCPILLIVGSNDDPRRVRQGEIMKQAHAGSRMVVIEGARHAVHKDKRSEVASEIGRFLDDVGAGRAWPESAPVGP